ncbi:MAG: hypothetical protein DRJ64_10090, partial [Thermoprotei archaeon]
KNLYNISYIRDLVYTEPDEIMRVVSPECAPSSMRGAGLSATLNHLKTPCSCSRARSENNRNDMLRIKKI